MANQNNNININDLFNDPNGIYEDHSFESIVNGNEMNYEDDLFTENPQSNEMDHTQPGQTPYDNDDQIDKLNANIPGWYQNIDANVSNGFDNSPNTYQDNIYHPQPYPDPRLGLSEQQLKDKKQAFIERMGINEDIFDYLDENIKQENPDTFLNYVSPYGKSNDNGVLTYAVYHPNYGDIHKQTRGEDVTNERPYETYPKEYLDEKRQAFMKRMGMNDTDMQRDNDRLKEKGAMVDYLSDEGGVYSNGSELPIYNYRDKKHFLTRQMFNTIGPDIPPRKGRAMAMAMETVDGTVDVDVNLNANPNRSNRQTTPGNIKSQTQGNSVFNDKDDVNQTQNGNGNTNQTQNGNDNTNQTQNGNDNTNQTQNGNDNTNQTQNGNGNANQTQNGNGNTNQTKNGNDNINQVKHGDIPVHKINPELEHKLNQMGAIDDQNNQTTRRHILENEAIQDSASSFKQKIAEMGAIDDQNNQTTGRHINENEAISKSNTQSPGFQKATTNNNVFESPKPKATQTQTQTNANQSARSQTSSQTTNLFGNGLDDLQNTRTTQQRY